MNTVKLEYCMNTVRVAPVEVFLPLLWRDTFLWNNPSCCEGAVRKRVDGGQRTVPRAGHCGPVPVVPPNPTQPGKGYRKNTGKPRHTLKEGDSFQVDPAVMLWQDRLVSNLCSQSGHCQAPRQRKLFR